MNEPKFKIPKKVLNKRTRDENIAVHEHRKPKGKVKEPLTPKKPKELQYTAEEIREKIKRPTRLIPKAAKSPGVQHLLRAMTDGEMKVIPNLEIVEEINKTYREAQALKHKGDKRQKNLYFSNTKACPRAIYYYFFEQEHARDYTDKGLVLFDDGDKHHLNLQRRLQDRGKAHNPEGYLELLKEDVGFHATGYYDQLYITDGGWLMLEIKSKFPGASLTVAQEDYDQLQFYMFGAQRSKRLKTKGIEIVGGILLYKDRAVQTDNVHYAWSVKADPERQQEILEYFRFLQKVVIDKKTLIPHPYERASNKCKFCRYQQHCWKNIKELSDKSKIIELTKHAELPEKELLESVAKKHYEYLKEIDHLKKEAKLLEPVLLNYFLKTSEWVIPITESEGVGPTQGSSTTWDSPKLAEAIGEELFIKISSPAVSKVNDLIKRQNVDAAKFEQFKTKKLSKPHIGIKKYQQGGLTNAD